MLRRWLLLWRFHALQESLCWTTHTTLEAKIAALASKGKYTIRSKQSPFQQVMISLAKITTRYIRKMSSRLSRIKMIFSHTRSTAPSSIVVMWRQARIYQLFASQCKIHSVGTLDCRTATTWQLLAQPGAHLLQILNIRSEGTFMPKSCNSWSADVSVQLLPRCQWWSLRLILSFRVTKIACLWRWWRVSSQTVGQLMQIWRSKRWRSRFITTEGLRKRALHEASSTPWQTTVQGSHQTGSSSNPRR